MENDLIKYWFEDDAKRLNRLVDQILRKNFSFVTDKTEFYSLAGEVFLSVYRNYDSNIGDFKGFLYSTLVRKFKTELTRQNREKRKGYLRGKDGKIIRDENNKPIMIIDVSIGAPISEDGSTFADTIESNFNLENEVCGEDSSRVDKCALYMSKLSKMQRNVLNLIIQGYGKHEIVNNLHITSKQYSDCIKGIRSHENVKVLY